MIKKCHICAHVGELTWRDGKYYCAMCGSEIAETEPQYTAPAPAPAAPIAPVQNAVCPICRNANNNTPCGSQYRCALCGTMFDLGQPSYATTYAPPTAPYGNSYNANQLRELHAQKDKKVLWGIVFLFLFWPVSIYFFYKASQINKQIKQLEY